MTYGDALRALQLIATAPERVPARGFLWEVQQPATRAAPTALRELLPPVIFPGDDGPRQRNRTRRGRQCGYSGVKESIRQGTRAYSTIYGNTPAVSGHGSPGQMWSTRTGFTAHRELLQLATHRAAASTESFGSIHPAMSGSSAGSV